MNKIKIVLLFYGLLLIGLLNASIQLIHTPIRDLTEDIVIQIQNLHTDVSLVKINFKTDLDIYYKTYDLITENTTNRLFTFSIERILEEISEEDFKFFYYFIEVEDSEGEKITYPEINPEFAPVQVSYENQKQKSLSSSPFVIISPENLNQLTNNQNIVVSFFIDQDIIDKTSFKVILDDQDISHRVQIFDGILVFFVPQRDIQRRLRITATTINGDLISSPVWTFKTRSKPSIMSNFDLYGSFTFINNSADYSYSNEDKDAISTTDQTGIFNMSFLYKKIAIKNYLYFSSLEDKENQRLNKYYLGFLSKHFDLHLGDYSPNYSEFTVNNRSVYGVSTSIKTGDFALNVTAGELNRKISPSDGLSGSFKREHLSSKIMFGNRNRTAFSLNVSKTKDVLGSLEWFDYYNPVDSINTIQGKDNIVIGTDFSISTRSRKFSIYGEVAMSMYNSNINPGVISKEDLEDYIDSDIPFDPETFKPIIIINKNIEPFQAGLNNSALKFGFRANYFRNNINFLVSQIGPAFYSLSSSGIVQDKRMIRVSDNIVLSNSLFLSAGIELAQDNTVDQKDYTINSQSLFFSFNYQPINLPYFNVNFSQIGNKDDLTVQDTDSPQYRTDFINQYISFTTGYSTNKFEFAYSSINLTYGFGTDKDNQEIQLFDSKKNDVGVNTIFRFNEFPLTTRFGVNYSIRDEIEDKSLSFSSFYLNNEYSFLQNKLIPFVNYRGNFNSGDQDDNNTHQLNLGTRYRPFKNTSINFDIGFKQYSEKNPEVDNDYNYIFSKIVLTQTF